MEEFGTQVVPHIPRLRRYARALTRERTAADDLVQDTLERACNKLHLWRRGSDLRAWLFTIMHNVFINQVRGRKVAADVPLNDEIMELPGHMAQADRLEIRDLDAALARLPDEQREVLLLIALEQMSYQETAKALGIPIGTVMSRLSRARERLRGIMDGAPEVTTLKVIK
ncbi:MAG: sigma-70 family RNA polymerase sigma factor [Burkholderiales bacterium]|nr:sigma-70 family RNA polymerase sigma factor [Burkholderiales bacterium]